MDKTGMMASSSSRVMEKPPQDQQPLKCPRCDSSNTKFCYYNNYSLTQPRHFCKACKRYWTRGGTLRNVPVGGGYRKNKKIKKASSGSESAPPALQTISSSHLSHQIDNMATHHVNPVFYGLSAGNSYTDFPFSRFTQRATYAETLPTSYEDYGGTGNGFNHHHTPQYHDMISSSNSILSNLSLLGPSSSSPAYASLISLQQQKQAMAKETRSNTNFQPLIPFEGLQMTRSTEMVMDEVKMERKVNKMDWMFPCMNQAELIGSSVDPSLNWNSSGGAWTDLANYGSSVTPMI